MNFKYLLIHFFIGASYLALMFLIPELLTFLSLSIVLILIHLRIIFYFKDKLSGIIAIILLIISLILLFNLKQKINTKAFSISTEQSITS